MEPKLFGGSMGVVLKRSLNISWQIYDDSVYIYDERTEYVSKLEDAGLLFWKCLDNYNTYKDILDVVAGYYNKSPREINEILENFIDHLVELGFIERLVN